MHKNTLSNNNIIIIVVVVVVVVVVVIVVIINVLLHNRSLNSCRFWSTDTLPATWAPVDNLT